MTYLSVRTLKAVRNHKPYVQLRNVQNSLWLNSNHNHTKDAHDTHTIQSHHG